MKSLKFWSAVLTILALGGLLAAGTAFSAAGQEKTPPPAVQVGQVAYPSLSPVMRDVAYKSPVRKLDREEINPIKNPGLFLPDFGKTGTNTKNVDPLLAGSLGVLDAPSPLLSFDGQGDLNMYAPPDTTGDVGPDYFIQMVNVDTAVYDKSGNFVAHWSNNQLWDGFGGPCETDNSGDPVVLYDSLADRWVLTQFAVESGNGECFAVSTTSDPLGTYYRYYFVTPDFPDYPKIGIWPDGYYMGTNSGYPNQYYAHVFDRQAMLQGDPAGYQYVGGLGNFLMPNDADGTLPPPAGEPGVFYTFYDGGYPNHPAGVDRIALYEFDVDWVTPANSTFTLAQELPIADFNYTTCGFFNRDCIPQLGTTMRLDAVDPWPMVRLQYRNLNSYQAMVGNFTVDVDGTDHAGIRWFELRKTGATWDLYQEGTWAPDANHRFMGSIAMDGSGNIALGYSISSASMYPSIRYTVHANGDALGTMQAEAELMAGGGSQTGLQRWGDYSSTVVDPVDNCTFWMTNEYHDVTDAGFAWNTRIGTIRIPGCTGSLGYVGTLEGTVTDASTTDPIDGASVEATLSITQTFATTTDVNGDYSSQLPVGTYDVTASAFGYQPETVTDVEVISGSVTTQDFALTPAVSYLVEGNVTDANTGWPLYASISIDGYPGDPIWTDPVTGYYSISLPEGIEYTFNVSAFVNGYIDASRTVGPLTGDTTEDFALDANLVACNAPGYALNYDWFENFEGGDGGFTVSGTTTFEWGVPTSGPGEAFSGQNVWATNLAGSYNNSENGYITSPNIDLSAYTGASILLDWQQWAQTESGYDYISVEVSNDGGSTWSVVYGPLSGSIAPNWTLSEVLLNSTYAVNNFRVRFHFTSDTSVVYDGWYLDDIGISAQYPPAPTVVYSQNFEADNGTYTHSGTNDNWEYGLPTTTFPGGCAGGSSYCWDTNLAGNYLANASASLYSPVIDLSGVTLPPGVNLYLSWDQAIHIESATYDHADAAVSINGGAYTNVWSHTGATRTNPWATVGPYDITAAAGGNIQLRYYLSSDGSVQYEGWSVDNVQIYYATPFVPQVDCAIPTGGLVVGNVYDANTNAPLVGAMVVNEDGGGTLTVETPADPNVNDGFYVLYGESSQDFTASMDGGYASDTEAVTIFGGDTIRQDFSLGAGWLEVTPAGLHATLNMGDTDTQQLDLANLGNVDAGFEIHEVDGGYVPVNINIPAFKGKLPESSVPTSAGRAPNAPQLSGDVASMNLLLAGEPAFAMDVYPGENLVNIPDTTVPGTWNIVGNIAGSQYFAGDFVGGDFSKLYVLDYATNVLSAVDTATAVPTAIGPAVPGGGETWSGATGATDGTLYAAATSCSTSSLYTIDTTTGAATLVGSITNGACVIDIAINANGEMYGVDIVSDSLIAIDPNTGAGTVVGSLGVNANYAQGMDFEETTGVLYWAAYTTSGELRVIDTTTGASTLVGAFPGGAEVDSLAFATGGSGGVPWLSESPITGTVGAASDQIIDVTFDAGVPEVNQPGDYLATLRIANDTPYGPLLVPVTMTVSVPPTFAKIEGTVMGLGYCDENPAALEGAQVVIVGASETLTLTTDAAGYFSFWLDESEAPLTISVTADEHTAGLAEDVTLTAGETTTANFNLRWLEPCVSVTPAGLEVTLGAGYSQTLQLDLSNLGAAGTTFELGEKEGDYLPPFNYPTVPAAPTGGTSFTAGGYHSVETGVVIPTAPSRYAGPNALTFYSDRTAFDADFPDLPVEDFEDTLVGDGAVLACPGPFDENTDNDCFAPGAINTGLSIWSENPNGVDEMVVLGDGFAGVPTAQAGPNYFTDNGIISFVGEDEVYAVGLDLFDPMATASFDISIYGPGDVLLGQTTVTAGTAGQFFGVYSDSPIAYIVTTGTGGSDAELYDNVVFGGVPADVPWLSEAPITGTVAADSAQVIDVTFDTMTYTLGTYTAAIKVKSEDPMVPSILIPVTMTIEAPSFGVELTPITDTQEALPGETVTYTLHIHNSGNTPNTFTLAASGNAWVVGLPEDTFTLNGGEGADFVVVVTIPADAVGGDMDEVVITATGAGGAEATSTLTTSVTVVQPTVFNVYLPILWRLFP